MRTNLLKKYSKEYSECDSIESIKDITDQFDYDDEKPKGKFDPKFVACGQDEEGSGYCELQNIYDEKLKSFVDDGKFSEEQAYIALCMACHEIKNPRARDKFYAALSEHLGVKIS